MRRPLAAAAVLGTVTAVLTATPAAAEPVGATDYMSRTWGVDGRVSKLVATSRGVIAGGDFTRGIAPSGASRPLESVGLWDPETGRFLDWPVSVSGEVLAVAVSGDTVYLGGSFTAVNGASRNDLAAVSLSTGGLLPWAPEARGGQVEALAAGGGAVYVGGNFTTVTDDLGTVATPPVARVSSDGRLDRTWTGSIALNDRVRTFQLSPDGSLYIGGDFSAVDGQSRYGRTVKVGTGSTATIDTGFRTGPNNGNNRAPVFDLRLSGGDLLIAAGGGGGGCAMQDALTGDTAWTVHSNGNLQAVAALGPYVYCGGHFSGTSSFGGQARYKLAAVQRSTGAVTGWNPRVNSALGVWALATTDTALVAGGDFTKVTRTRQPHLGEFRDLSAITTPAEPVDVSARPGDGSVALQWGEPDFDGGEKVTRYAVLRADPGGSFVRVATTSGTTFTDSAVTNGTTYRYQVQAHSDVGDGTPSATVTATPDGGLLFAPTVPRSFTASGGSSAHLTWDAPASDGGSPITAYRVYREVGGGSESLLRQLGGSARSTDDTTCPLGETCGYRVSAVNAVGEGPKTDWEFVVANSGVPSTPVLTGSAGPGTAVTLQWSVASEGGSPIKRCVVIRDSVRIAKTGGTDRSYVDTAVQSGRSYTYKVRCVNSYGASDNSNAVTVRAP